MAPKPNKKHVVVNVTCAIMYIVRWCSLVQEIADLSVDLENYKKQLLKAEKRVLEEQTKYVELQNEAAIVQTELKKVQPPPLPRFSC